MALNPSAIPPVRFVDDFSPEFRTWLEKVRTMLYNPVVYGRINLSNLTSNPSGGLLEGGQILFPSTANLSTDGHTLDRYEESTFTPGGVGGTATYNSRTGFYTCVGNICHFQGLIDINTIGTGATTNFDGLPIFSAGTATAGNASLTIGRFSNAATAVTSAYLLARGNGRTIDVYSLAAAGGTTGLNAFFGNGTVLYYSGMFITA